MICAHHYESCLILYLVHPHNYEHNAAETLFESDWNKNRNRKSVELKTKLEILHSNEVEDKIV